MAMTFTCDEQGGILGIRLTGRLTLGPQLLDFGRKAAETIGRRPAKGVILDVAGIEEIDSAGLGELVILYTTASQHGCRLCLVQPTPKILQLLETTKLSGILPCYPDHTAAIAWLSAR